jgi:hypothetical protein
LDGAFLFGHERIVANPDIDTRSGVTSGWAVIRQELENPNAYIAQ